MFLRLETEEVLELLKSLQKKEKIDLCELIECITENKFVFTSQDNFKLIGSTELHDFVRLYVDFKTLSPKQRRELYLIVFDEQTQLINFNDRCLKNLKQLLISIKPIPIKIFARFLKKRR